MNPDDPDETIGAQIPMDNEDSSQHPFPVPAVHSSPIADELGDRPEYQDFDTTSCYEMESVDDHPFPLEAVQPQQVFRNSKAVLPEYDLLLAPPTYFVHLLSILS